MATSCNIRVIARFRPLNDREKAMKENQQVLQFPDENSVVVTNNPPFTFDRVFPPDSTQDEVFECVEDTIVDVLKGYNGTIFAYGQTGSGKSHTMFGDRNQIETWGIIPRSNVFLFNTINDGADGGEITIKCSFLEIYMEQIQDLLNPKKDPKLIKIRESKTLGIFIEGLAEEFVSDENDILDLIAIGESSRSVASTKMNAKSSRSHSILIIQVEQKSIDGSVKRGKLNLVDLAGSEKVSKTGAEGQTLEEAKKINQSLSLLGNCIHALTDSKREHIPFRDSKLTRLLQDSLGGNTKTTLIITGSPHYSNVEETLSTLKFGSRAKTIKNTVKVNQQKSAAELQAIVTALSKELSNLKLYSISLENLVNYFKSNDFLPGNPIPKHLEFNKEQLLNNNNNSTPTSNNNNNSNLTPKSKTTRNSVAISSPSTNQNSNNNNNNNRHSVNIFSSSNSSTSHSRSNSNNNQIPIVVTENSKDLNNSNSSVSSLNNSTSSTSNLDNSPDNKLYDPLTIIELSLEIEKMRDETQNLIDKFKDEISDMTIKYESAVDELSQSKQQLEQSKEQISQERNSSKQELQILKESERNLILENKSNNLKIQNNSQKVEDFKLLCSQILQYLERKKSIDYFDSGMNSETSISQLLQILETDEEIQIEDILRFLSEEEILSMQLKIQLQNKVELYEQKIQEFSQMIDQLQITIQNLDIELLNEREKSSMSTPNNNNENENDNSNSNSTTPQNSSSLPIPTMIPMMSSSPSLSSLMNSPSAGSSSSLGQISDLKLKYEKEVSELQKQIQDQNIKQLLQQNQIANLQNDLVSTQNKLAQEKKVKQQISTTHEELELKFNDFIKDSENKFEELSNEKLALENQNQSLLNNVDSLELKAQDLQEQLISTQRLLNNRRVVKVVRGDEKSMKRAYEQKVEFGQQFLKKTGKTLY